MLPLSRHTVENEAQVVLGADGVLPKNHVVSYGETLEDSKTIYDAIYESLFEGKKSAAYNAKYNELVKDNDIVYFKKVYKSLYKDLD